MNETTQSSNTGKIVVSGLASAGFLLLFALILWLTYLPTYRPDVSQSFDQIREEKLIEVKSSAKETLSKYTVVDKDKGIYRVPVDIAMELTVKEYQN